MSAVISHLENFITQINKDRNPFTNPSFHKMVPRKIKQRWDIWDQTVEKLVIQHFDQVGTNIFIPPQNLDKPCILLLAHHDTVPYSPGVDDNASGVAVVDYLAYYFSKHQSKYNLAFAVVDWEESDPRVWKYFLEWSKKTGIGWDELHNDRKMYLNWQNYLHKHVQSLSSFVGTRKLKQYLDDNNIVVEICLDFEMVGYTSDTQKFPSGLPPMSEKGDFIALIGNIISEYWIKNILAVNDEGFFLPLIIPDNGKSVPDTRRSDHAVFWDENIPAIMITDTANFRNPHYHTKNDIELDYNFMEKLIKNLIKLFES